MTAFNPSSGPDLGLPGRTSPSGPSAASPLAVPSLLTASAQTAADPAQGIRKDSPLLALLRQLIEERAHISGSDGQLSDQEMRSSLARTRDLARCVCDEPIRCGDDLVFKLLALHRVAESTL